jgi:superfamily II DNA/RNA helicase
MNTDKDLSSPTRLPANNLPSTPDPDSARQIATIVREIQTIAERSQGDPIALLRLLRALEQVHRDIQGDYFQSALPDSRQALYALLRDIEENGGWPYIQRWKLHALFANLEDPEE